jgi:hypothetical protein
MQGTATDTVTLRVAVQPDTGALKHPQPIENKSILLRKRIKDTVKRRSVTHAEDGASGEYELRKTDAKTRRS